MGHYYYGARRSEPPTCCSIFDGLTLSPLPYPVLLVLTVIFIFLGISWYSSYEEVVETAEEGINWFLLVLPISIVFAVKWLSSMEDCRRPAGYCVPPPQTPQGAGVSPWAVAAVIILLLVLVQCQSI